MVDLTGMWFGNIEVLEKTEMHYKNRSILWKCLCHDCGNIVYKHFGVLKNSSSCGCTRHEKSRKYNKFEDLGNGVSKLYDSNGNYSLIDTKVVSLISDFYWFQSHEYFISVTGRKHLSCYRLHSFIYSKVFGDIPKGFEVDHINRIKFDNRIDNLRLANRSENIINRNLTSKNTSGYTGVSKRKDGRFRAYISVNRKQIHLGLFDTAKQAYKVRLKAEKKYYGEFSSKGGDFYE